MPTIVRPGWSIPGVNLGILTSQGTFLKPPYHPTEAGASAAIFYSFAEAVASSTRVFLQSVGR